ncbi:MAG: hypothetical protein A2W99_06850 [Bacteroidetes bacterium GWF2_33_16]|nr:MAG: hypothetical protein A2X00_06975 [Bacteroidetes bacterium GWE2_32_14]OFY02773.1 MAG: hypothetical protein A2W99_06850 [Bacteroidetes bacterium GWF2_33_16]
MRKLLLIFIINTITVNLLNAQYIYPVSVYESSSKDIDLSNFDIKDTLLFLPLGNEELQILNISDINNINKFSKYEEYEKRYGKKVFGNAYGIKVIDNRAYLSYGDLGLKILDITDPETIYSIGTYYRHQEVYCVEIFENFACLGYKSLGLEIIDFSDLSNITMVSRNNVKDFSVKNIQILSPYIMISGGDRGLKTFKFKEPITGFKQAEFPKDFMYDAPANKILVRATTGYVANDFRGLSILNLNLPLYPHEVGNIKTNGKAIDLAIDRNYLYVVCSKSIEVYDIKEPEKPEKIFEHVEKDKKFQSITIKGSTLFASFTTNSRDYGIMVFQVE